MKLSKKLSKKTIGRLQDLIMVILSLTAVLILVQLPIVKNGWSGKVSSLLSGRPGAAQQEQPRSVDGAIASLHFVVTGDGEYGRFGRLYALKDDPLLQQILPLFQEALGSAADMSAVAGQTLQAALARPSLYLDLDTVLPQSVVAAWLGERMDAERPVRSLVLSAEEDTADLYLICGEGEIMRYRTALPSAAVLEVAGDVSPNGCHFAYETNYGPLAPYTVLVSELAPTPDLSAGLPPGYSAFDLLSILGFNPYTTFRYTENSGVEVVEESPHTLRIGPDGTVVYLGSEDVIDEMYRLPDRDERAPEVNALAAAKHIADVLTEGTGASPLTLTGVESMDDGFRVTFAYEAEGVPIHLRSGEDALEVITSGETVTSFIYHCRSYMPLETRGELMPPEMAVAIASLHPGAGLSVGYVDGGGDVLSVQWLAN